MRFSMSTYCFAGPMRSGRMSQLDAVRRAGELGFDAVEIQGLLHGPDVTDEAWAAALRQAAQEAGIAVSCFTFDADLLRGCGGDSRRETERVCRMLELAAALGAPCVRHDCTVGPIPEQRGPRGFADYLPVLAEACRKITEAGAALGIRTMVENHGTFCQESRRVEQLVNAVGHPNFGLLTDIGNFLCADEDPAEAVGRVAPYTLYAHAKDFHRKTPMQPDPGAGFFRSRNGSYLRGAILGHGDVPVRHCLSALKLAGFDGTIAIEFEGMEEPDLALPIGLENLKRYWAEA